jgi:hypothetical protein
MLRLNDFSAMQIAGRAYPGKAPLFFWLAALLAKLLGGVMPLHDAARSPPACSWPARSRSSRSPAARADGRARDARDRCCSSSAAWAC